MNTKNNVDVHSMLLDLPNETKMALAISCAKYNIPIQRIEETLEPLLNEGISRVKENLTYLEYGD